MKKNKKWIIAAVLMLLVLVGTLGGAAYARYTKQVMVTGTVSYQNRLAESFGLKEHAAETLENGEQTLVEREVNANNYLLIPGMPVMQDPFFTISGRSNVKAMLFMEMSGTPIGVELKGYWEKLDGVTGQNGGDVYVYTGDINDGQSDYQIAIFEQGEALSSYPSEIDPQSGAFKAVGYLIQVNDDAMTPSELFTARIS